MSTLYSIYQETCFRQKLSFPLHEINEIILKTKTNFSDQVSRLLRDGVRCRRRPDDAHPRGRLLRTQGRLLHGLRRPRLAIPSRKQNHLQVISFFGCVAIVRTTIVRRTICCRQKSERQLSKTGTFWTIVVFLCDCTNRKQRPASRPADSLGARYCSQTFARPLLFYCWSLQVVKMMLASLTWRFGQF